MNIVESYAPNEPNSPTFRSKGIYLDRLNRTLIYFIEINNPVMPLNGVTMNILYKPTGTRAWTIADQITTGSEKSRIDDLTPGHTYQFAAQAFSVVGRKSIISAALTCTAPRRTVLLRFVELYIFVRKILFEIFTRIWKR